MGDRHFKLLKTTYDEMALYRTSTPGAARTKLLRSIATHYIQISGRKDIFRFDKTQWAHDPKGKTWRVRKAA